MVSLKNVLLLYGLTPKEVAVLREKPNRNIIIKVLDGQESYIAKIYRDGWTTSEKISKAGKVNNYFCDNGLPFARILKAEGQFFQPIALQGKSHILSVEEYIPGNTPRDITPKLSIQMAALLARQHKVSCRSGLKFGYPSCWSLIYGNNVANDPLPENQEYCQKLLSTATKQGYPKSIINEIKALHRQKLSDISAVWSLLPQGPIQGDWGIYNMKVDNQDNLLGIYDFNIAGDEVYINELAALIGWCIKDIPEFIQAYTEVRSMTKLERDIYPTLMQVIKPFRYDRVASLIQVMEQGDKGNAIQLLQQTVNLMTTKYVLV